MDFLVISDLCLCTNLLLFLTSIDTSFLLDLFHSQFIQAHNNFWVVVSHLDTSSLQFDKEVSDLDQGLLHDLLEEFQSQFSSHKFWQFSLGIRRNTSAGLFKGNLGFSQQVLDIPIKSILMSFSFKRSKNILFSNFFWVIEPPILPSKIIFTSINTQITHLLILSVCVLAGISKIIFSDFVTIQDLD